MRFLRKCPDLKPEDSLELLNGDENSCYYSLSDEVHDVNERDIAEALHNFNDDKQKSLFFLIFHKSVEEVLQSSTS